MRLRCPDLRSIDDEVIAVLIRGGSERCQVRTRIWFGVPLTPGLLTRKNLRDESLLLSLGPPLHQRWTDERQAGADVRHLSVKSRELLVKDDRLHHTSIAAAVIL